MIKSVAFLFLIEMHSSADGCIFLCKKVPLFASKALIKNRLLFIADESERGFIINIISDEEEYE